MGSLVPKSVKIVKKQKRQFSLKYELPQRVVVASEGEVVGICGEPEVPA